jgi:hypothetical protein
MQPDVPAQPATCTTMQPPFQSHHPTHRARSRRRTPSSRPLALPSHTDTPRQFETDLYDYSPSISTDSPTRSPPPLTRQVGSTPGHPTIRLPTIRLPASIACSLPTCSTVHYRSDPVRPFFSMLPQVAPNHTEAPTGGSGLGLCVVEECPR